MCGLHKSKRISWASDLNLCQVRLFLSEDSPSQVGLVAQDHLQAKASALLHPTGPGSDDVIPPGFEGAHSSNRYQLKLSEIPLVKWTNPPRFVLNLTWQVVAGEESEEVEVENNREMRTLEAIYPRPSAIPPNPSVSPDVEDSSPIDEQIPLVPITPIEDEDAVGDAPSDSLAMLDIPVGAQPSPSAPEMASIIGMPNFSNSSVNENSALGVEPDVGAAASAAFAAIMKSNEPGNLIDNEMLIKILSNPKLIEKLVTDYGAANMQNIQNAILPISDPPPVCINKGESSTPSSSGASYHHPPGLGIGPVSSPRLPPPPVVPTPASSSPYVGAPPAKDMNYYKSLIQQHGGERQDTPPCFNQHHVQQPGINKETVNPNKSREPKPKIMKPCIYFNSSRGCRNGANCAYQHDVAYPQRPSYAPEAQSAKRMRSG